MSQYQGLRMIKAQGKRTQAQREYQQHLAKKAQPGKALTTKLGRQRQQQGGLTVRSLSSLQDTRKDRDAEVQANQSQEAL